MTRDEEINKAYDKWQDDLECSERTVWQCACRWADEHPAQPIANLQAEIITLKAELESACEQLKMNAENIHKLRNPWVMDRMPEIKENGWSDPVLLRVDGQFLKVSRYCRRKDGTTYWIGVDDWNGEEVDAWMPIELKGDEK